MPQSNLHIHHVQFDPQGSDGASAGMVYDQSIRPYKIVDPQHDARRPTPGDTVLRRSTTSSKFQEGVFIGVGLGTEQIEIRQITAIDAGGEDASRSTRRSSARPRRAGQWAGTEFMQERWYPDVDLDNVFWHDHVDGIHGWGKGLVGQLIVEPKGSTYHDPKTGEEVDSGTIVDIHTTNPLAPGLVDGSFRELALWTIGDNPVTDSTLNLRAEPWSERLAEDPDPSLLFSSWRHGDPRTPLPQRLPQRPVRDPDDQRDGQRHRLPAPRPATASTRSSSSATATATSRGRRRTPSSTACPRSSPACSRAAPAAREGNAGDYLYMNGIGRRFRQGAWGLLRVLPGRTADLQPLPGHDRAPTARRCRQPTGGRPPVVASAGRPCPTGAPARQFAVSAVDLPEPGGGRAGHARGLRGHLRWRPTCEAGRISPEPLVLHAAAGECVTVQLTQRAGDGARLLRGRQAGPHGSTRRASTPATTPSRRSRPGEERTYRYYADSEKIGSADDRRLRRLRLGRQGPVRRVRGRPGRARSSATRARACRATSAPRST